MVAVVHTDGKVDEVEMDLRSSSMRRGDMVADRGSEQGTARIAAQAPMVSR